jgi:hypothetical protein
MLAEAELECLFLVTPKQLHAEMAQKAIARKLPIFMEKPLATSSSEGNKVVEAAKRAGIHLQIGFVLRFETQHAYLKQQIASGIARRRGWRPTATARIPSSRRSFTISISCFGSLDSAAKRSTRCNATSAGTPFPMAASRCCNSTAARSVWRKRAGSCQTERPQTCLPRAEAGRSTPSLR